MKFQLSVLLAGSSLLAISSASAEELTGAVTIASPALIAAAQQSAGEAAEESDAIVVTARRREELLQDVPAAINVVSGAQLDEFAIQSFEDVEQLVPGIDFTGGTSGTLASTSFRGATFSPQSGTTNLVGFYVNDAPIESNLIMQNTYDLGQIEFLRGTQGTLRGESAPSGAVTVATRRPDLHELGGYANSTFTSENGINLQGAVNVPIVTDMLALRVAGVFDENDVDSVQSLANPYHAGQQTESARATLLFEPTSNFSASLMYQNLERTARTYTQVMGGGIQPEDRLSTSDEPNTLDYDADIYIAQADLDVGFGTLSYVGSYTDSNSRSVTSQDVGNVDNVTPTVPRRVQDVTSLYETESHELRISSNEPLAGFVDYTVGLFTSNKEPVVVANLSGGGQFALENGTEERSVFGNLNFHITDRTDLSLGARYLEQEAFSETLSGIVESDDSRTLYNASLSHRFTDDLMAYVSAGTAARYINAGTLTFSFLGANTAPGGAQDDLRQFIDLPPEESENYEIGLKSTMLDGRLTVNTAIFRQEFTGYAYQGTPVYYWNPTNASAQASFTSSAAAIIDGVEIDARYEITSNWNVGFTASYADGHLDNATIPCNDANGDGVEDGGQPTFPLAGANSAVALCSSSGPISQTANWNATLQSEYSRPVSDSMEGFVRGFYQYYPENDNGGAHFTADAYGLLNLFVGLRSPTGNWEAMVFARNALDEGNELSRRAQPFGYNGLNSIYYGTSYTPEQVFGVSLSTAIGSR